MGPGVLSRGGGQAGGPGVDTPALLTDAGLRRKGGSLLLGGVRLSEIAAQVGTPTFVYNLEAVRERYCALDRALVGIPHRICYAVKANGNLAVLAALRALGAGADIVSAGEMQRAITAGFAPATLVFSGVGKTAAELRAAVQAGVGHVNVESPEELRRLGEIALELERPVAVGIRVNPDVTADTHPYISTGKGGIKFGIPADQVLDAAAFIVGHPRLELASLAMHLGSQLRNVDPYQEGLALLLRLVEQVRARGITTLESLDLGGGFGVQYAEDAGLDIEALAAAIIPLVKPTGLTLYVEPGRYLVGSAGVLLTEVLYRKHSGGKDFVIVDAGMNDLMRPSLYQARHEILEVEAHGRPAAVVDVVGPVCETGDFLALDRMLPAVESGERLAVLGAGAYGFAMSSNYNSRPRAAEVVVDGARFAVARPRETADDLFRGERADPFQS